MASARRTVLMLAGCQALAMTGGSIVGLTGAIVGNMLTPDKALSTLPIAVQQAGVMAATIPAALVMAGGVVSAVFGAEVAKWSRDLFEPALFAGCYALIVVLFLASALMLYFVELPKPPTPVLARAGRPLREIAVEPPFIAAAVAA